MAKSRRQSEYGDFQTPRRLAQYVCRLLRDLGIQPASVVEPTCGQGSFLLAALDEFPDVQAALGMEINPDHVAVLAATLTGRPDGVKVRLEPGSFFQADWPELLRALPEPLLVIGNPPWVTNAELGALGSANLPRKENVKADTGLDALTGKSNFDLSEAILLRITDWLEGRTAILAMLCKTAVARRVLAHAWRTERRLGRVAMYGIDAGEHFAAAVDACLLVCQTTCDVTEPIAAIYPTLRSKARKSDLGWRDGQLIADIAGHDRLRFLAARRPSTRLTWRSGVKHDCAKVMEFIREGEALYNKLGERVDLESTFLFPMLKSSQITGKRTSTPETMMLVTQTSMQSDTSAIRELAPRTWQYLIAHAELLDARRSAIYRNRARFAMFGIGDYTFAPFKVVTSGLYKQLHFEVVGSETGKPTVLDDTAYFLPCQTREAAILLASLVNSSVARSFYSTLLFWDSKRPITAGLLRQLDLAKLAAYLGREEEFVDLVGDAGPAPKQALLF